MTDIGTPERHRHGKVVQRETMIAGVIGAVDERATWLDCYRIDGLISVEAHDIGVMLAEEIAVARGAIVECMKFDLTSRCDHSEPGQRHELAERRVAAAMRAAGTIGASLIVHVVRLDQPLATIGHEYATPYNLDRALRTAGNAMRSIKPQDIEKIT